jgi:LacI family transcriptional regulator, galactose operon repressor
MRSKSSTIIDVAQLAGVSIKTVSRVINNERHVSAETRRRVRDAVEELGFEANSAARGMRSLRPERSHVLAHFYGDPGGIYVNDIQLGMMSRCRAVGYSLVVEELDYQSPEAEARLRSLLRRVKPDGAVLTAPLPDNDMIRSVLENAGVPYVPITPLHEWAHLPSVRVDERRAAYQLTQHLISYGHRRIGFLRGLPNHAAAQLRFDGFEQAMREAGLEIDPTLVEVGEFRYFVTLPCAQRLLSRPDRPTAIVASNDEMAAAVIKVAHELEIKLPEELSVVGFDDIPAAEMLWPPLTTVRQPVDKLGAAAADLLFACLGRGGGSAWPTPAPHHVLQHDIVLRASTAPPGARSSAGRF